MPTATFVHKGDAIDYTPSVDVAAGAVVVVGDLVAIAKVNIPANTLGALATIGVYDVPKTVGASEAIGFGVTVYWDEGNQVATTDAASGANKYMGKTVITTVDNDPLTRVRLDQ